MYDLDVHFLCSDLSKAFDTPAKDLMLKSIQLASDNNDYDPTAQHEPQCVYQRCNG